MELVALDSCRIPGRTDMLHHGLYHGVAVREDRQFPNSPSHNLGDDLSLPLLVSVGANPLREFFQPCTAMVLSSRVKSALAYLSNVAFLPVQFQRLVGLACPAAGDYSIPRHTVKLDSTISFLGSMPHCPHLLPTEPYFELVLGNAFRLTSGDPSAFRRTISMPHASDPKFEVELSAALIEKYPIFWSWVTIFRRDAFDVLDSLGVLEPDYFTWTQFAV